MSSNELIDRVLGALADAVKERLPAQESITAETLKENLGVLLQEAEWFKEMVAEIAENNFDVEERVREVVGNHDFSGDIDHAMRNFDFSQEIESAMDNYDFSSDVEQAVTNHDFSDAIDDAVRNHDIDAAVENAVDNAVADLTEQVERVAMLPKEVEEIKARVERHDKFIKAMVQYALDEETKPEVKE